MLQEISPHVMNRAFLKDEAKENDLVLCYHQNSVLICIQDGQITLPKMEDLPEKPKHCLYAFSLDKRRVYLCDTPKILPPGFEFWQLNNMWTLYPQEIVYACHAGMHLRHFYSGNKYCGRCASPMEHSKTERAVVCPNCGRIVYPQICPVIIAAIVKGDELLMIEPVMFKARWGRVLVTGYTEFGEMLEETLRREVLEEVGLQVKNIHYYKSQPWPTTDAMMVGFYCEVDGDSTIHVDHVELKEAFWVHRDDIPPRDADFSLTGEMIEKFRTGEYKNYI